MKRKIVTVLVGIFVFILITAAVVIISSEDKTGPEIEIVISSGKDITYQSGQDKQILTKYAKATDGKDGDVSDSIKVEDIYVSSDLSVVNVIFVARDKSNNITKLSQQFKYLASQEEIMNLAKENDTTANNKSTQAATVSATTVTKASETTNTTAAVAAKPVLFLTQSETTIQQGETFTVNNFVKDITDDKDPKSTLFRRIVINGNYNVNAGGDYSFSIFCTDTEGNQSNVEKFTLHVTAKPVETQLDTKPQEPDSTEQHDNTQQESQSQTQINQNTDGTQSTVN